MDIVWFILGLIIGLPITLLVAWLLGLFFRISVLKHNVNEEYGIGPKIVNILIGLAVIAVVGIISNQLGCYGSDFESNSSFR